MICALFSRPVALASLVHYSLRHALLLWSIRLGCQAIHRHRHPITVHSGPADFGASIPRGCAISLSNPPAVRDILSMY